MDAVSYIQFWGVHTTAVLHLSTKGPTIAKHVLLNANKNALTKIHFHATIRLNGLRIAEGLVCLSDLCDQYFDMRSEQLVRLDTGSQNCAEVQILANALMELVYSDSVVQDPFESVLEKLFTKDSRPRRLVKTSTVHL